MRSLAAQTIPLNTFVLANSIGAALFDDSLPLTLIRTRGRVLLKSDQLAINEQQQCLVGVAVVTQAALTLGVTAMPDPATDADGGMWQTYEPLFNVFDFQSAVGFQSDGGRVYEIDSKAMRKIDTGFALVLMVTNPSAGAGIQFAHDLRFLFKLH